MAVADFFLRIRLILYGCLLALGSLFVGFGTAPFWLHQEEPSQRTQWALWDGARPPQPKQVKSVLELLQKKEIEKVIIYSSRDNVKEPALVENSTEDLIFNALVSQGISSNQIATIAFQKSGKNETQDQARAALKILISENKKSVLVLTNQYASKRVFKIYSSFLNPATIALSLYSFPSDHSPTNWFQSEKGLLEITVEVAKYWNSLVRGAF